MAQMVAKAMANQDRANAEQQAMINRLADDLAMSCLIWVYATPSEGPCT